MNGSKVTRGLIDAYKADLLKCAERLEYRGEFPKTAEKIRKAAEEIGKALREELGRC